MENVPLPGSTNVPPEIVLRRVLGLSQGGDDERACGLPSRDAAGKKSDQ